MTWDELVAAFELAGILLISGLALLGVTSMLTSLS